MVSSLYSIYHSETSIIDDDSKMILHFLVRLRLRLRLRIIGAVSKVHHLPLTLLCFDKLSTSQSVRVLLL